MRIQILKILFVSLLLGIYASFSGCANQQPPSGGEDDKVPPRVKYLFPKPDAVNFKGSEITIEFDEYVDRRSFIDAFFVTPKPNGGIKYDWSGKEVTVKFEKGLKKNTTYLFVIGKVFKDIRNNSLGTPIQFAISTGPSLDKGKVSGRVYGENFERTFIFAYKVSVESEGSIDPSMIVPDYIMPVSTNGTYSFENLASGRYRLFTVYDGDFNGLYDKTFERISITDRDVDVNDSLPKSGVNFILKDVLVNEEYFSGKNFINRLRSDSVNAVFTNIAERESGVGLKSRYYFYFRNRESAKEEITGSITLKDTSGRSMKFVSNWQNDSLLEVTPTTGLYFGAALVLTLDYKSGGKSFVFKTRFTIADERKFGEITGAVTGRYTIEKPIVLKLIRKDRPEINFTRVLTTDSVFTFSNVLEGEYYLAAFIDSDNNGRFDTGEANPYRPAERAFLYGNVLNLKGAWKLENIAVSFF